MGYYQFRNGDVAMLCTDWNQEDTPKVIVDGDLSFEVHPVDGPLYRVVFGDGAIGIFYASELKPVS